MKTVAAVLCSLVLILVGCEASMHDVRQADFSRQATIPVEMDTRGVASAVVIAPKRVLTAAHVAADDFKVVVNGKPTKVLYIDEKADVAVLEAEVECPCVPIADQVSVGEETSILGFPLQNIIGRVQVRAIGEFLGKMEDTARSLFYGFAMPGYSGGGIFNKKGELVGVVSGLPAFSPYGPFAPPQLVPNLVASPSLESIKTAVKKAG